MKQNLIRKLQKKVKSQSVNSLGSIYPDDIIEWLGISETLTKELITDLHEQRILLYKYRLKCNCGEICTIYEHKLFHDTGFYCEVCGKEFSVDDVKEKAEIIYDIDKDELLNIDKEVVDFKILPSSKGKIVPLNIIIEEEQKKMEIFMGSSSEAKDYMDEIAVKLEELGTTPLLWYAPGKNIFIPGTNTIDALVEVTKRVQAAVFIFNKDDKIWNDKSALEASDTVRDNVLFEYGLFVGALGKRKVCFICKGNPKLASDLKGVTYIDGDLGDSQVKLKLRDWIQSL